MSKNIIIDYLLGGELDQKLTLLTDELKRLLTIACESSDKLTATLSSDQKLLLESYRDAKDTYHLENLDRYFSEGFKAGILIGLEIKQFI